MRLDISLDELFADELMYLIKGKEDRDIISKFLGAAAALKILAEYLQNL